MPKHYQTLILDYDGTLHNSIHIYEPAFRKAYAYLLNAYGGQEKTWSQAEIKQFLGQSPKEMWANFPLEYSSQAKQEASQIITQTMQELLDKKHAVLYDHALEVLRKLKARGYHLIFLSNCKMQYKATHDKTFDLSKYFDTLICTEEYDYAPKEDIIKVIKQNYPADYAIIGDRYHDINAGIKTNITTVACTYGFGSKEELEPATYHIDNIKALLTIFE
ncbi:MAG: HAD family hydrolase [Candidatus Izemoplasma sp.]|nr:HAD family hydrolase [Candidatus Izemoplasma sp.]